MLLRKGSVSYIELVLIGLAIGVGSWAFTTRYYRPQVFTLDHFGRHGQNEMVPLLRRYGPQRNSLNFEELIIRDYFSERRDGVFVDVGAYHYRNGSNTYYLESV